MAVYLELVLSEYLRIYHTKTGELLAEGQSGWSIMPFEGNYYIHPHKLKSSAFKPNWIPGICIYKFVYVWLDWHSSNGEVEKNLGWRYVLPNPLFPFIWFRVAVSGYDPRITVTRSDSPMPPERPL